ncbi:hypothetical protein AB0J74_20400 [Asanoa sp. NPDC049573]|uniref:hypothetical protein n=1 Tax=Asanoa sp. NPDC049573 TaxID=3155396 RepID=UPI0034396383
MDACEYARTVDQRGVSMSSSRGAGRRAFLKRGGAVAAGAVAGAVVAGPAQAAPGDAMILGAATSAGDATTSLEAADSVELALLLENANGPALRLTPTAEAAFPQMYSSEPGTVLVDEAGQVWNRSENGVKFGYVWSTDWAQTSVSIDPVRVLDTRNAAGRAAIVSNRSALDSAGRLRGGQSIVVSLDSFVTEGQAVKANLAAVDTTAGGYLTIWGSGSRPTASSLNWWAKGQVLSAFVFVRLGASGSFRSVVTIFANTATHVLLDVTSFVVAHPSQVKVGDQPAPLPGLAPRRPDAAPEIS